MAKLTKSKVEAIKPAPGEQVAVWDSELKGYGVRVSPGGTKTFFVQGRIKGQGKMIKATIGKFGVFTAEQARDKARNMLTDMANGKDPRIATMKKEEAHTFGDLLNAYADMLEAEGKESATAVRNSLKRNVEKLFPKLWKKPAIEIDIDDCLAIIGRQNDDNKPRQADKLRAYIKAAFTRAINARGNVKAPAVLREMKITTNPARDIQKVEGSSNANDRALTIAELQAYWKRVKALEEPRRSLAMLHLLTGGQRMKQLSRVTLADIDRDSMVMVMQDIKGRRSAARVYGVPLLPQALECIDNITGGGTFVFSANGGLSPINTNYLSSIAKRVCDDMAKAGELTGSPFTGKHIRSSVETRLMGKPYRVSSDVFKRLLSHGMGGVQEKHYQHDSFHDEQLEALEMLWRMLEAKPEPSAQVIPLRAQA